MNRALLFALGLIRILFFVFVLALFILFVKLISLLSDFVFLEAAFNHLFQS
jgi:hypothetical protein